MKIKTQIIVGISGVSILLVCFIFFSVKSLRDYEASAEHAKLAKEIVNSVFDITIMTNEYLTQGSERTLEQWKKRHASLSNVLLIADRAVDTAKEKNMVKRLRRSQAHVLSIFLKLTIQQNASRVNFSVQRDTEKFERIMSGQIFQTSRSMVVEANAFDLVSQNNLKASMNALSLLLLLITMAIFILLSLVLAWFKISIFRPLENLQKGVESIREGNLGFRFQNTKLDEFGALKNTFNAMTKELAETLVSRDIVEMKNKDLENYSKELEEARRVAEKASLAKSSFLASMSHEIRTPMAAIIGFSDLLLKEDIKGETRDNAQRIKTASEALLVILNDILDVSRLEAGKFQLQPEKFNLSTLVNEVSVLFEGEASKNSNLELITSFADDLPQFIKADPTRLRQILVNLIGNAVKFTEKGSVSIDVSLKQFPDGENFLDVTVTDTGIGMKPEFLKVIFSDFTQADTTNTRKFGGSGLGLAICKQLIELMGGDISVDSEFGKGTTMNFYLPFETVSEDEAEDEKPQIHYNPVPTRALDILVAEDNLPLQIFAQKIIESLGHKVTIVGNGLETIAAHKAHDFDMIVTDIHMPEMNGIDAAKAIRDLPDGKNNIPIIALTADALEEHVKIYSEAGMNGCVTKPIDQIQFFQMFNQAMGEIIHAELSDNIE